MAVPVDGAQTPYDYTIVSARIYSEGTGSNPLVSQSTGSDFDVAKAIVSLEIFEHLEKPFVTGLLVLYDNVNLYNAVNFLGTEIFEVEIEFPDDNSNDISNALGGNFSEISRDTLFRKKFVISALDGSRKYNDVSDVMIFHLVEYELVQSRAKTLSKMYKGEPLKIMKDALTDGEIEKEIDAISEPMQSEFKYLSPYITPFQICEEIKRISSTPGGLPYFLYSTLKGRIDDSLILKSLEDILGDVPIVEAGSPMVYSQLATNKQDETESQRDAVPTRLKSIDEASRVIENYKIVHNGDILASLTVGLMGATLDSVNINQMDFKRQDFNVTEPLAEVMEMYPGDQQEALYDDTFMDGKFHSEPENFNSTNLVASNTFTDGSANYHEISGWEDKAPIQYAQRALMSLMSLSTIDVQMPGYQFFGRDRTIGKNIYLQFMANDLNIMLGENTTEVIDKKKSGMYSIYAMRHSFAVDRYTVTATCVKFTDKAEGTL